MADTRIPLPDGTELQDRYRIEQELGRGGFGLTYRATDVELDQPVVLKEYYPLPGPHEGPPVVRTPPTHTLEVADDHRAEHERRVRRLLKEARVFGEVRHPHLARVYEAFKANGTAYLVMGFVQGPTLRRVLRKERRLDADTVARLLEQIGGALGHLHACGILHLDVKPDNIIRSGPHGDQFVLIDFGEACTLGTDGPAADPDHISLSTGGLTPAYAAIEQYVHDMPRGPHTDVYALGVTGYESLAGQLPPTPIRRQMEGVPLPVDGLPEGRALALVMQALGVRPDERPATVAAWLGAPQAPATLPYTPVITLPPVITQPLPPKPQPATPAPAYRNHIGMEFVLIPAGEFWMGSESKEGYDDEKPVHRVRITQPFYLGKYPVTQGQWQAVMGTTIEQQRDKWDFKGNLHGVGDSYPIYYVSWDEAQAFIKKLNGVKDDVYRLPTEAEWEYACRQGGPQSQDHE